MAEEKLQYTLTLATRATGTGAKEVAADLQKVAAMSTLAADKAKVSSRAHYNLDEAMGKTAARTETVSSGITKVGKSSRDSSMALLMFSQGFEDAQYGIRGILNNIPPLVMALGGTAGLAGVVSLAAVSFSMLGNVFDTAGEKTGEFKKDLDEILENSKALFGEEWDKKLEGIDTAREKAAALNQTWDETKDAEKEAAMSALDNTEKLANARLIILQQLGYEIDAYGEIEAIQERAEAKRILAAQQEADAVQRAAEKAKQKAQEDSDYLGSVRALRQEAIMALDEEGKKLEKLRADYAEAKRLADAEVVFTASSYHAKTGQFGGQPREDYEARRQARDKARATLASDSVPTSIKDSENKIQDLAKRIADYESQSVRLGIALDRAVTSAEDKDAAMGVKLEAIQQALTDSNSEAVAQTLEERAKAQAEAVKGIVGKVEPANAAQQAALDTLSKLASDGQMTANDSDAMMRNLGQIFGGLQVGISKTNENMATFLQLIQQTIARQASYDTEAKRQAREMQRLGNLSATLPQR